jgi:hypothetical protein
MAKNANQLYKEYRFKGGTLSFAEWIDREKKKGFMNAIGEIPANKPLTDSIQKTLDEMRRQAGYQDKPNEKYILGVNRGVVIGIGIVAACGVAFLIYKKVKK